MGPVAAGASSPGYSPLGGHTEHQNAETHWVTKAQGRTGEQGQTNPAHKNREQCQFVNVLSLSGARQAEPVARRVLEGIGPEYRDVGGPEENPGRLGKV